MTESNQFISNSNLRQWDCSPKDIFNLMAIIDAIPAPWRRSLKMNGCINKRPFIVPDEIQLVLSNRDVSIEKATSKSIYAELISVLVTSPTAQSRYHESFDNVPLNWKEIYSLPFKVALYTKSREFQYKNLNRYLVTNTFLEKIGKTDSSACSFCGVADESLEHLFVSCHFTATLWEELIIWCNNKNIKAQSLSIVDIFFGDWQRKDDLVLLNHIILIPKQYIYYCRINISKPLFNVLLVRIKSVYLLECQISKRKTKKQAHSSKWGKCCFDTE